MIPRWRVGLVGRYVIAKSRAAWRLSLPAILAVGAVIDRVVAIVGLAVVVIAARSGIPVAVAAVAPLKGAVRPEVLVLALEVVAAAGELAPVARVIAGRAA